MSAFKLETWLKQGYTEEEARYQIAIRRPNNHFYYMHKYGVDEATAIQMKLDHQSRCGKKAAARPTEEIRRTSHRCIEYWLDKGYSEEDAKKEISKIQSTFSLEKCIAEHGEEKGRELWQERQNKWQSNLNSKPQSEIDSINRKKSHTIESYMLRGLTRDEAICELSAYLDRRGVYYCTDIHQYEVWVRKKFDEIPSLHLRSCADLKRILLNKSILMGFDLPIPFEEWILTLGIELRNYNGKLIIRNGKNGYGRQFYNMWIEPKVLLKSMNEITFYFLLIDSGFVYKEDFLVNKRYPGNSNRFYDFYMIKFDKYVELAGDMSDESYADLMHMKQQTFGSVILKSKKEYLQFIEELKRCSQQSVTLEDFI